MRVSLFSDFYFEFIQLVSDLKYTLEMHFWEFKDKLIPRLQNQLNFGIELLKTIFLLAKCCLSIYKQMQIINQIKEKAKSFTIIQITANVPLRAVTSSIQMPTILYKNTSFLHLSNIL